MPEEKKRKPRSKANGEGTIYTTTKTVSHIIKLPLQLERMKTES